MDILDPANHLYIPNADWWDFPGQNFADLVNFMFESVKIL